MFYVLSKRVEAIMKYLKKGRNYYEQNCMCIDQLF